MKRWCIIFTALLIIVSLITGGPMSAREVRAAGGGEGHVATPAGSIDHLDPALWYFGLTWRIGFATCTPLVTFSDAAGEEGKQIVGGLAALPEISDRQYGKNP